MLDALKSLLKSDYVLGRILKKRYEHRFKSARNSNLFYGIYPSYQRAMANLPDTKPAGYNNHESADLYQERANRIHSTDYPMLYWFRELLKPKSVVFEVGGHIGVSFYAYDKFMGLGEFIEWTIQDVTAVTVQGRELARSKGEHRLHFTDDMKANEKTEIVFVSGALQYIEASLSEMILQANISPEHVLVNLTPVNDKPTYFTINNIGTAFCPYKISNKDQFINEMSGAGYDLCDSWDNPNKRCVIPFQDPSYSLHSYMGFYFKKKPDALLS